MVRSYYTLIMREDGVTWTPEFGDYSRACVMEEMADMKYSNVGNKRDNGTEIKASDFKVICTVDNQDAINHEVAMWNEAK